MRSETHHIPIPQLFHDFLQTSIPASKPILFLRRQHKTSSSVGPSQKESSKRKTIQSKIFKYGRRSVPPSVTWRTRPRHWIIDQKIVSPGLFSPRHLWKMERKQGDGKRDARSRVVLLFPTTGADDSDGCAEPLRGSLVWPISFSGLNSIINRGYFRLHLGMQRGCRLFYWCDSTHGM